MVLADVRRRSVDSIGFPGQVRGLVPTAAGDVRAGSVKRVAAAADEGAVTVPMTHSVLSAPTTP